MYNVYVYAACTVCVTIFSTGSKFKFYVVTRSYSSHLFTCALDLAGSRADHAVKKENYTTA